MAAYVVFNTTLLELKKEKKQKTFFFVMHPFLLDDYPRDYLNENYEGPILLPPYDHAGNGGFC